MILGAESIKMTMKNRIYIKWHGSATLAQKMSRSTLSTTIRIVSKYGANSNNVSYVTDCKRTHSVWVHYFQGFREYSCNVDDFQGFQEYSLKDDVIHCKWTESMRWLLHKFCIRFRIISFLAAICRPSSLHLFNPRGRLAFISVTNGRLAITWSDQQPPGYHLLWPTAAWPPHDLTNSRQAFTSLTNGRLILALSDQRPPGLQPVRQHHVAVIFVPIVCLAVVSLLDNRLFNWFLAGSCQARVITLSCCGGGGGRLIITMYFHRSVARQAIQHGL